MTFLFRDAVPVAAGTVSVAFTDRRLDLGDRAEPRDRAAALAQVAEASGATPYLMRQVHGAEVHVVEDGDDPAAAPEADALVTGLPGVALLTRAADCVPVLLVTPEGVLAAVHAGREGVRRRVVPAAVQRVGALGGTTVSAWIGPHICGACYEVPEEMREQVAGLVPAARATTSWGTPALDLGAAVRAQLEEAGAHVVEVGGCTREDDRLHSHRRDGVAAGRLAGVVWRAP